MNKASNIVQQQGNAKRQEILESSAVRTGMLVSAGIGLCIATVYYVPIIDTFKSIGEYAISYIPDQLTIGWTAIASLNIPVIIVGKQSAGFPKALMALVVSVALTTALMIMYYNYLLTIVVAILPTIIEAIKEAFRTMLWVILPCLGFPFYLLGPLLYFFRIPVPLPW